MQRERIKKEAWAYLLVIIGSALFAIGDVMFVSPYLMAPGGTYGLANVLNTVWPWQISWYAICMDVPLLLIGTWILGPRFGIKTVVSTFLIFAFTWVLERTWGYDPVIHDGIFYSEPPATVGSLVEVPHGGAWFMPDYFLNTVVAGIIYGISIGLIFKSGATSGGSDIISMILHKYTKISLGTLVIIVDSCITLSTLIAHGQIRLPIYSILIIYIEGKVIDLVVEGRKSYKTVFIITEEVDKVRNFILNDMHRGGTFFIGKGLYQGAERTMIYCSMERADFVKLKNNIHSLDPHAFVNVMSSNEILGEGFKSLTAD
ncbi:MAG: YitT family protein [Bacteroidales bacterium]|nr:YitT family protein [Bacteroidales bacterium]